MNDMSSPNPTPADYPMPQPGQTLRAKWVIDGAASLEEAAERLEAFATHLRDAAQAGWSLAGPVEDDYGTFVSPQGDAGFDEEESASAPSFDLN